MTKQELKEKIIKIIDDCYFEDYLMDEEGNSIPVEYFRYENCVEEIEKLFKEVE